MAIFILGTNWKWIFDMSIVKSAAVSHDFFLQEDVVSIARELIGTVLVNLTSNRIEAGIIAETEAYAGATDRASHAFKGKKTKRTASMFLEGGHAYVYLCYGMHKLFNIVTNTAEIPHAVLIRGLIPLSDKYINTAFSADYLPLNAPLNGPAKLTKALGIGLQHDRILLNHADILLFEKVEHQLPDIIAAPRVGIDYAGEDAKLLYRFYRADYRPVKPV